MKKRIFPCRGATGRSAWLCVATALLASGLGPGVAANGPPATAPYPPVALPFRGTPARLPGVVRAAEFDQGGEGGAYHDSDDWNTGTAFAYRDTAVDLDECDDKGGGCSVGGTRAGEWLAYTVDVQRPGAYDLGLRLAYPGGGSTLHVEFAGRDLTGPITVSDTGGWHAWRTVTVPLKAEPQPGRQTMRVVFDSARTTGGPSGLGFVCNLNWVAAYPRGGRAPDVPAPADPPLDPRLVRRAFPELYPQGEAAEARVLGLLAELGANAPPEEAARRLDSQGDAGEATLIRLWRENRLESPRTAALARLFGERVRRSDQLTERLRHDRAFLLACVEAGDPAARGAAAGRLRDLTGGQLDLDASAGPAARRAAVSAARETLRAERARAASLLAAASMPDGRPTSVPGRDLRAELDDLQRRAMSLYRDQKYDEATLLFKQLAEVRRQVLGERHPDYAGALNNLGLLYRVKGDYAAAEPLLRQALEILRQVRGERHPDYASALNNLGVLYRDKGDYAAAEPLLRQVLEVRRQVQGERNLDYAGALNNLGTLYQDKGDYAAAEPLLRQALEVRRQVQGERNLDYAGALNNLGNLYQAKGDSAAAEPLLRQALEVTRQVQGERNTDYATALNNLGRLFWFKGDYAAAEPLLRQALEVWRQVQGERTPGYAAVLFNLGMMYRNKGDYAAAEPLLQHVLEIRRQVQGERHRDYAIALGTLGMLYQAKGDDAAAEPFLRQALEVFRQVQGERHLETAGAMDDLCICLAGRRPAEALDWARRAWEIRSYDRGRVFMFASEAQQMAFAAGGLKGRYLPLSLAAERLPGEPEARRLAASVVLAGKAEALEVLTRRRTAAAASPAAQALYVRWQDAAAAAARESLSEPPPGQLEPHRRRLLELTRQAEEAERDLAQASAPFAALQKAEAAGPAEVAAALPEGSALVEFARYHPYRFEAAGRQERYGPWNYLAVVVRGAGAAPHPATRPATRPATEPVNEPDVALVRLGEAGALEAELARWRRAAARPAGDGERDRQLGTAAAALWRLVWEPVERELRGSRRVYLSPDGDLAFLPFAALPGRAAGSLLLDEYDLSYVATGRDLVRREPASGAPPLVVGDPAFDAAGDGPATRPAAGPVLADAGAAGSGSDLRAFGRESFRPLPGAAREAVEVAEALRAAGLSPRVLTGAAATEAAVKQARRPSVLHLATHGFFLPDSGIEQLLADAAAPGLRGVGASRPAAGWGDFEGFGGGEDWVRATPALDPATAYAAHLLREKSPMRRSGVALAGANLTVTGRRPAGGDDGILTAEEAAAMDLWGTRLVVVSACESGLGESRGNEGVYGLRRAFALAGAQNLITALWSVDDQSTERLMRGLYQRVAKGQSPPRALLLAQREFVATERAAGRRPDPFAWAAFVCSGTGAGLEAAADAPLRAGGGEDNAAVEDLAARFGAPTPFRGRPAVLPAVVRAVDFDEGGDGVAFHTSEPPGADNGRGYRHAPVVMDDCLDEGRGFNVGRAFPGEWLAYTVEVGKEGAYDLDLRLACPGGGGRLHVEFAGRDLTGPVSVPDTGNWQAWRTVTVPLNVAPTTGRQIVRVVFDSVGTAGEAGRSGHVCNLNWFAVYPRGAPHPAAFAPFGPVEILTREIAAHPGDAKLLAGRALFRCRRGEFDGAADDYAKAVAIDPTDHMSWYGLACLRLYLGDDVGYRRTAGEMLDRFKGTADRLTAERTLKTCLLTPWTVGDPTVLAALADRALAPGADPDFAWFELAKGILEYRAGRFADAVPLLERSRNGLRLPVEKATAEAYLAMCHHRLGKAGEAQTQFAQALQRVTSDVPKPGEDIGGGPQNWLVCQIAIREARATVPAPAGKAWPELPAARPVATTSAGAPLAGPTTGPSGVSPAGRVPHERETR